MKELIVLGAVLFTAVAPRPDADLVPAGAIACAESRLQTKWKPSANPELYGLTLEELSESKLGEAFLWCRLTEAQTRPLREGLHDPREDRSNCFYVFPVECDGQLLACLAVKANRDRDGSKLHPDRGDYLFVWQSGAEAAQRAVRIQRTNERSHENPVALVFPGFDARPDDNWHSCVVYTDNDGVVQRECEFYPR